MSSETYTMQFKSRLLNHGAAIAQSLHDATDEPNNEVDALVASGDCFVTLATELDQLDQALTANDKTIQPELEKVIRTLLHLQRHYTLRRKHPNYRQ